MLVPVVVLIPASARTAKSPAVPRSTDMMASTPVGSKAKIESERARVAIFAVFIKERCEPKRRESIKIEMKFR
jgi:hypothetical protein